MKSHISKSPVAVSTFILVVMTVIVSVTGKCYGQILKIYPLEDYEWDFIGQLNQHRTGMGLSLLQRSKELDEGAEHHAMYLALHFEKYGTFGNHKESIDIPGFTEYYNCRDRPGNPAAEVIDHVAFGMEYHNQTVEEILFESPALNRLTCDPRTMFMRDYLDSPPHRKNLEGDFKMNQVGTCCFLVLLEYENPEIPGLIKCYFFNVTTLK